MGRELDHLGKRPAEGGRTPWLLAGATLLLHLAVANRYDYFRDELYFIICGRHPSFGYVDQPPIMPLLAAGTQLFGQHLWLLRAIPALAAAATVLVACALARLAGAGRFGVALAGIAVAIAPMYLGLMTTLNTGSFEPLLWTTLAWLVARATVSGEPRAFLWAGLVVGVDLEIKYSIPLYLAPLFVALIVSGRGRDLLRREVLLGALLAIIVAAPSFLWQLTHELPFLELVHNQQAGDKNTQLSPPEFVINQAMVMNPALAPLWLAGALAPLFDRRFRRFAFLSLAFALTFALLLVLRGKDYFLAPAYGAVFALGAAAVEAWLRPRALRAAWLLVIVAISAVAAPLAMPILDPPVLARYIRALKLGSPPTERLRQSEIPQTFADMVGWRSYVQTVEAAVGGLPPEDRARVAVYAHNYGEAAALDFFGRDLPPALSTHNQYYLWGTRGYDGSVLLRINEDPERLRPHCSSVALAGRFGAPYAMPFENGAPIALCRGLRRPLGDYWEKDKLYY